MSSPLNAVILAAGQGKRMRSSLPKVMHCIAGKPMLQYNLDLARKLGCSTLAVVVGHGAERVRDTFTASDIRYCLQAEQKGTGHAVMQAMPELEGNAIAVILYGDVPMLKEETLAALLQKITPDSMGLLTSIAEDPAGLGRIIRDSENRITAIIEHRDASDEQRTINEVNTGIMVVPVNRLNDWLPRLRAENDQQEYYLTDIIAMAVAEGCAVHTLTVADENEVAGVNDRSQLAALEQYYQRQQVKYFMTQGVTFLSPEQVSLRGEITMAEDVVIDMSVVMEGRVSLEKNVSIGPNCVLKNCSIGEGTVLEAYTHIEDASIGKRCNLGPFARVRPGSELDERAKLGNFVETKKARIGKGSKVNHFSYIGDAELGAGVNIGAGTIVCNYDGANKYKTTIGNNVFIGSNSTLVAPVQIADEAFVAAGSTITHDVGREQLAVARGRQRNIDGWKRPVKKN